MGNQRRNDLRQAAPRHAAARRRGRRGSQANPEGRAKMSGAGHIRRRGKHSWELKFDAGRDEVTGKRIIQYHSFKGTRSEAKVKLAELVAAVGKGEYVSRSKLTVGEHVKSRIDQWEAMGEITPKTAERYRELLENQIRPHLGVKALQKLKPVE